MVGGTWLGQNADPDVASPVVDQIQSLVGATATVLQRIPGTGNTLRVATNVISASGTGAIGTYNPREGRGRLAERRGRRRPGRHDLHRHGAGGRLLVRHQLRPLFDGNGGVTGMIYVGVKQENLPALRQSLLKTSTGEHGTLWVLGGTGDRAGTVLVSKDGSADGTSLIDATDADGTASVQEIVAAATALTDGEQATVHYQDPDTGRHTVQVASHASWDWGIVVDAQDSDLAGPNDRLADGRRAPGACSPPWSSPLCWWPRPVWPWPGGWAAASPRRWRRRTTGWPGSPTARGTSHSASTTP